MDDICVIEFADDIAPDFFKGTEFVVDESSVATSKRGHQLFVAGVLKEKLQIDPPNIHLGLCRLTLNDAGVTTDPILRRATAVYLDIEFEAILGMSGSPVFDLTANKLCGMVVRGGLTNNQCQIFYVDISDIARMLEAVKDRKPSNFYLKWPSPGDVPKQLRRVRFRSLLPGK
jgi:hypothetical protein